MVGTGSHRVIRVLSKTDDPRDDRLDVYGSSFITWSNFREDLDERRKYTHQLGAMAGFAAKSDISYAREPNMAPLVSMARGRMLGKLAQ